MDAEQERIEREIARERIRLGDDVDALVEKVSPQQAARRQVGRVASVAGSFKDRVMGRTTGHHHADGPRLAERAGSARASAGGAGASAGETVASATDSAAGALASAKETAVESVKSSTEATRRNTEGNPLAAGLIAFGVGWLVSSLLPPSDAERQATAALRSRAEGPAKATGQRLGESAHQVADQLREPAREAAEAVRRTAGDAVGEVKEQAGAHAGRLGSEAQDRASTVRRADG